MVDDLKLNIAQRYECGLDRLTGKVLIYMPIKGYPEFCVYSLVSVLNSDDYTIYPSKIKELLRKYRSHHNLNIIRPPQIELRVQKRDSLIINPTKKQRQDIRTKFALVATDYFIVYRFNKEEEKRIRFLKKHHCTLEEIAQSQDTIH